METPITAAKETECSSPALQLGGSKVFLGTLQHNNADARMATSLKNAFLQTSFAITEF